MPTQEIKEKMSKGEWQNDRGYRVHSNGWIAQTCGMDMPSPNHEERANAAAICSAVNNTFGKGINPEAVFDLLECLRDSLSDLSEHMNEGQKKHFQKILNAAILK